MSEPLLGILESLPNPAIAGDTCPRRAKIELDLMLLAIEAIPVPGGYANESGSSEEMLQLAKELDLDSIIKNRIVFWRIDRKSVV